MSRLIHSEVSASKSKRCDQISNHAKIQLTTTFYIDSIRYQQSNGKISPMSTASSACKSIPKAHHQNVKSDFAPVKSDCGQRTLSPGARPRHATPRHATPRHATPSHLADTVGERRPAVLREAPPSPCLGWLELCAIP